MHRKFDHKAIEKKWQEHWEKTGIYTTTENPDKPKCFVLDMFPYPSGEGLHVGHPKGYIATDIYSRFKTMTGHEVLHPMGWDAFGLPAENYAIKNKVHPRVAVEKNVANFKSQLAKLGFNYDWDREINTTDPEFYKWTQWIFLQLFKKGLAKESYEPINWCPGCQTGLANEDLESDGTCERCDSVVEKRPMRQWVLNIRAYADRMLEDLDTLEWPEHIKEAQRNWIGRSKGAEIDFKLSVDETVTVFTTRPDTLYGATYMVLAPEHELVIKHRESITNWSEVELYVKQAANKKEMDRLDDTKEKTGVKLEGITATNPASGEAIPVYIADYVLAGYGTGAIMAVPAHDERDFAFATKFGIDIKQVVLQQSGERKPDGIFRKIAVTIIENSKGEILIQSQKTSEGTSYCIPGGGVDEGEDFETAALREAREETGYHDFGETRSLGQVEANYFHSVKKLHRQALAECFVVKLKSDNKNDPELTKQEQKAEFDHVWLDKNSALKLLRDERRAGSEDDVFLVRYIEGFNGLYAGTGVLANSEEFDGMDSEEAKAAIVEKVRGRMTQTYKIKDWVFSRQRYWGEPIPIVHCEKCGPVAVPEDQLPITLPEVEHYEPAGDGQSPLATIDEWVNTTCPTCDGPGKRETNTMPQWAGSSWYYLRFMDNKNDQSLVSPENEKYWAPVDVYVGGDHAVRHLIYARFWHKFLYDEGIVSTLEPFQRLEFLGFILAEDGRKMSKRWGNVINPDDIVELVGADTLRVYEMFMGPFENTIAWSQDGLAGARRFLERVNGLNEHVLEGDVVESPDTVRQLHKTIKKVSGDIEAFKFNTAVSAMMIFINVAEKEGLSDDTYATFLQLLAPFAPHLTEELWMKAGGLQLSSGSEQSEELSVAEQSEVGQRRKRVIEINSIHLQSFPEFDPALAKDDQVTIGVQINGKMRGEITIEPDADEATATTTAQNNQQLQEKFVGTTIQKVIYVPGRILNFIVTK